MPQLAPWVRPQFFDTTTFAPLAGGKLYTYQTGTSTPKTTYSDSAGSSANANPVILDSRGECDLWLATDGEYRFVLKTSADVTLWTRDNIKPGSYTDLENTSNVALGDALVGVKLDDSDTVGTTQHQVNQETVSVFRWFTAAQIADVLSYGYTMNVLPGIQNAVDYCKANKKNLFHPAGGYLLEGYYPVRQTSATPTALDSYNSIHIFGEGRATVIRTNTENGADVFQLNAVQDVVIRDLTVTGTKDAESDVQGINGVSITNGGKNIKIHRVHAFDLPWEDKSTYVDGGKAFTVQPGSSNDSDLVVEDIEIAYCSAGGTSRPAFGFGMDIDGPTALANSGLRAPKNIRVHHNHFDVWYRGTYVSLSANGGSDNFIPGMSVSITDNHVYNAQYGHASSRASGLTVARNQFISTLTGTPSSVAWDTSRIPLVSLGEYLCQYRGNNAYYAASTHYAQVGGVTHGTNGNSYHCEYSGNKFGGTSSGDGFDCQSSGSPGFYVVKNSSFLANAFKDVTGGEYDATLRNGTHQNAIIDDAFAQMKSLAVGCTGGTPSGADLIVSGAIGLAYTDGYGAHSFLKRSTDNSGVSISTDATSNNHARILEILSSGGALRMAVRQDGQLVVPKTASASSVSSLNGVLAIYDPANPSNVLGYLPMYGSYTP